MIHFIIGILLIFGCKQPDTHPKPSSSIQPIYESEIIPIIPRPVAQIRLEGKCILSKVPTLHFDAELANKPETDFIKTLTIIFTGPYTNLDLKAIPIYIRKSDTIPNPEGYTLKITPESIHIGYQTEVGVFYAFQSLRQLIPPDMEGKYHETITLPCVDIYDYPAFRYRGMHLDECRHFFGKEAVKQYIDMLAFQKMNYFHWHLTDDQGWRIEIKKYPKLTSIGGCRSGTLIGHAQNRPEVFDSISYCHYYSQEEIKEIVAYAAKKFITIIPEIEMPGHASAAISAYPELGCTGKNVEVVQKWGVFKDIFCPSDQTFAFLENVLTEVMDLFPSKYIHIGGDEVDKTNWKNSTFVQGLIKKKGLKDLNGVQSYFIHRIEKFVNSKGRQIIGWDEILDGGLAPNAIVMSWRGINGGIKAANMGHESVMTPGKELYFDHYQDSSFSAQPLAFKEVATIRNVYHFKPITNAIEPAKRSKILGAQANLWTEYIPDQKQLQYMAYPRSFALAEVVWSPENNRDYKDFLERLDYQVKRLDTWGINYGTFYKNDLKKLKNN